MQHLWKLMIIVVLPLVSGAQVHAQTDSTRPESANNLFRAREGAPHGNWLSFGYLGLGLPTVIAVLILMLGWLVNPHPGQRNRY